jgi:hypothetical protein
MTVAPKSYILVTVKPRAKIGVKMNGCAEQNNSADGEKAGGADAASPLAPPLIISVEPVEKALNGPNF